MYAKGLCMRGVRRADRIHNILEVEQVAHGPGSRERAVNLFGRDKEQLVIER